jgi:hypothetical protein
VRKKPPTKGSMLQFTEVFSLATRVEPYLRNNPRLDPNRCVSWLAPLYPGSLFC